VWARVVGLVPEKKDSGCRRRNDNRIAKGPAVKGTGVTRPHATGIRKSGGIYSIYKTQL
jgi:hypothetical protein